jgi:LPXTG-motif cell wall-anchored protein
MKKFASIALITGGLALLGAVPANAGPLPGDTLALLAAGERTSVLTLTTGDNTTSHNGTGWYYWPDNSMGFVFDGAPVSLNSADVYSGEEDWSRLSWSLFDWGGVDTMGVGARLGEEFLDGGTSASFQTGRYIYTADTLPTYYPSGPQENVDVSELDGWTLCWSNLYGDSDTAVDALDGIWAACDGAYLMFAGGEIGDGDPAGSGPGAEELANTGADSGWILGAAIALMVAGTLVAIRRQRA